jgi:hypothetical protein
MRLHRDSLRNSPAFITTCTLKGIEAFNKRTTLFAINTPDDVKLAYDEKEDREAG